MNKLLRMFRHRMYYRAFIDPNSESEVIERFHRLYYELALFGKTWKNTTWFGVPTQKCPLDCWVYQEILFEVKPDLIIETGSASGGSALFLASLCELLGRGRIISIDAEHRDNRPAHPRVQFWTGSSVAPEILARVKEQRRDQDRTLVILDSDHRAPHVLAELRAYSPMVSLGSYLIVEDSNLNGHPVHPEHGPGPMEALEEFLQETNAFAVDQDREKFLLTFNPRGYLRRVR